MIKSVIVSPSFSVKQLTLRIDGVFLPIINNPQQPIYFLEVKFQPDTQFYSRFCSEIFLYLDKTELTNDWCPVVIYPNINVDTRNTQRYRELLNGSRVSRIYLNELVQKSSTSLGIATLQLIIAKKDEAIAQAEELIKRTTQQIEDETQRRELLQLIETILVYKLPKLSSKEIEAMFSLSDLRQTKVWQEAVEEGREEGKIQAKLDCIPRFLALGLSVEEIAQALELEVEQDKTTCTAPHLTMETISSLGNIAIFG